MMAAPKGRGRVVRRDLAVNAASAAICARSSSEADSRGFFGFPDKVRLALEATPILEISMRRSSALHKTSPLPAVFVLPLQSLYDHLPVDHPRPPPPTRNRSSPAHRPGSRGPCQFQSEPKSQHLPLAGCG